MLVLSRRVGEKIILDGRISVAVQDVNGNQVRLAIVAPAGVIVDREEIHLRRVREQGTQPVPSAGVDDRDLFIAANPTGATAAELRKDTSGFIDDRTHADYLIFKAGICAARGE